MVTKGHTRKRGAQLRSSSAPRSRLWSFLPGVSVVCSALSAAVVAWYMYVSAGGATYASAWLPGRSFLASALVAVWLLAGLCGLIFGSACLVSWRGRSSVQIGLSVAGIIVGMSALGVGILLAAGVAWGSLLPRPPG